MKHFPAGTINFYICPIHKHIETIISREEGGIMTLSKLKSIIMFGVFFAVFLPVVAHAGGLIQLPKTGQTKCYDSAGTEITCTDTGQDGNLQAGVAWPNPRYTDNGDQTQTDNLTGGLIWNKDANAPGPSACSPGIQKTWQGALDYVKCLNTRG